MRILGLTGQIATGKSYVAKQFLKLGVPVFDADAEVHALYQDKRVIEGITKDFPQVVTSSGTIDRTRLAKEVFQDRKALVLLESLIHPLVRKARERFLFQQQRQRKKLVVLEIPLLFETKGNLACDKVIVTTAPYAIQYHRVMQRPSMTDEKFQAIRANQMPVFKQCFFADYVIRTGLSKALVFRQVKHIVKQEYRDVYYL